MKVLVTGAAGQLGRELQAAAPAGIALTAVARAQLDIGDRRAVLDTVARVQPALVINAAAYTAVDQAEAERELAFRINAEGAGHLAEAAATQRARLIHVSTDYVFDGRASTPYQPDDATSPVNAYGESKLAGEQRVTERSGGQAVIVRTAWVYAAHGKNFVRTMLRLMRERPEVRVVDDQRGSPTHAGGLAQALWKFAAHPEARGIFHWTDAGVTTWHGFALAIAEAAGTTARVVPIPTRDYPTPARRAAYSVLDCTSSERYAGRPRPWKEPLAPIVRELLRDMAP